MSDRRLIFKILAAPKNMIDLENRAEVTDPTNRENVLKAMYERTGGILEVASGLLSDRGLKISENILRSEWEAQNLAPRKYREGMQFLAKGLYDRGTTSPDDIASELTRNLRPYGGALAPTVVSYLKKLNLPIPDSKKPFGTQDAKKSQNPVHRRAFSKCGFSKGTIVTSGAYKFIGA